MNVLCGVWVFKFKKLLKFSVWVNCWGVIFKPLICLKVLSILVFCRMAHHSVVTTAKLVHLEMTWGWILRLLPSPPHPPTAQRPRGRSCHAVSSLARLSVICYKTVKVWWYVGKTFKVKGMCAWGSKTIKNEEEKISTTHVFDFHDSRIYVFTAHFSVVCATFKDQELCYLMGNPSWPTDLCSISSALALSTLILLHIIERRF